MGTYTSSGNNTARPKLEELEADMAASPHRVWVTLDTQLVKGWIAYTRQLEAYQAMRVLISPAKEGEIRILVNS